MWGIVLDHYYESEDGTRITSNTGLMFDTEKRSAFALYYKNSTINSENKCYLRTLAHEVGHAFNLNHDDGDGSTTIMTKTSFIDLATFVYGFSSSSLTHLAKHDSVAVFPNLSERHYDDPHTH